MTEERTLSDVLADLWQARAFVLAGLAAGVMGAAAFTFAAVPHYRAAMIVSPANPMNGAEVSSLLADDNLFALRYLMQRVGVGNSSDFIHFENTYAGPATAAQLLQDETIRRGLALDKSFVFSGRRQVLSAEELAEYIGKRVRLEPVGASPLRRLAYSHPSRSFGTYFLQAVHAASDRLIRDKIRSGAAERITYLKQAIEDTVNPEHRRSLTTLLLEQERLRMLVSIETPYAAAVIEPPAASVRPVWPDALLVFPAFMLAGALAGYAAYGLAGGGQAGPVSARRWFRTDSENVNKKRPLTKRDAA